MNIFFLEWNSYGNEDMQSALRQLGHQVTGIPITGFDASREEIRDALEKALASVRCDFLFSFNYAPNASICCMELGIKYVSWVYDSPHIQVYSYTVLNDCNYIFLFDYALYQELAQGGISTVYYLPLAVNAGRLEAQVSQVPANYACDISFVGSTYSEPKHRLYDKFQGISPYAKGYLDSLIEMQRRVYGYHFLQEMLSETVLEEMQKVYPTNPDAATVMKPAALYADYVLARQVTALERREILEMLPGQYAVHLYTREANLRIPGVENKGQVDYYREMPYVFAGSKINLNITLRSIRTGIPLRAFDIMGSGGFLLSNYQQELPEYFVPDEDFVYYSDYQDLLAKVDYYLHHDKERQEIAMNGCRKVRTQHTYENRIQTMLDIINGG